MLTMVLLMRALDPLWHEQETDLYLEKLKEVDSFRQGYYSDLSKYAIFVIRMCDGFTFNGVDFGRDDSVRKS